MGTHEQRDRLKELLADAARVHAALPDLVEPLLDAASRIAERMAAGGKLLVFGNGGSAAQAQHIAAEFVGRFEKERAPLPALALTTDTSALSAIGNDSGFENVFARQLRALAQPGDAALAISTSGNSTNVLHAIDAARELNLVTIGLSGRNGGKMRGRVDLCLCAPSDSTPRIQEAHLVMAHMICQLVENALLGGSTLK
jgi:D-sedoheptulose 7-phosphate isomerase